MESSPPMMDKPKFAKAERRNSLTGKTADQIMDEILLDYDTTIGNKVSDMSSVATPPGGNPDGVGGFVDPINVVHVQTHPSLQLQVQHQPPQPPLFEDDVYSQQGTGESTASPPEVDRHVAEGDSPGRGTYDETMELYRKREAERGRRQQYHDDRDIQSEFDLNDQYGPETMGPGGVVKPKKSRWFSLAAFDYFQDQGGDDDVPAFSPNLNTRWRGYFGGGIIHDGEGDIGGGIITTGGSVSAMDEKSYTSRGSFAATVTMRRSCRLLWVMGLILMIVGAVVLTVSLVEEETSSQDQDALASPSTTALAHSEEGQGVTSSGGGTNGDEGGGGFHEQQQQHPPNQKEASFALISLLEIASGSTNLRNPTSHSHAAMQWLVHDDDRDLTSKYTTLDQPDRVNEEILQRFTLAAFYYGTGGADGLWTGSASGWLTGKHECDWHGISCRDIPVSPRKTTAPERPAGANEQGEVSTLRTVTGIQLSKIGLTGDLPLEMNTLRFMERLVLDNNFLVGTIPAWTQEWAALEYLGLNNNGFFGNVPTELSKLKGLEEVWIEGNNLDGSIPASICSELKSIQVFVADCLPPSPRLQCDCCTMCFP